MACRIVGPFSFSSRSGERKKSFPLSYFFAANFREEELDDSSARTRRELFNFSAGKKKLNFPTSILLSRLFLRLSSKPNGEEEEEEEEAAAASLGYHFFVLFSSLDRDAVAWRDARNAHHGLVYVARRDAEGRRRWR